VVNNGSIGLFIRVESSESDREMSPQAHPAALLVGGTVAWIALLALGAVALRALTARLKAAGIEMENAENAHCGNVHGIDDPPDSPDERYDAESVLCPSCGARNERDFHRCRSCVSPMHGGLRTAD
jgi:ribosomal protein L40E